MSEFRGTEAPCRVALFGAAGRIAADWQSVLEASDDAEIVARVDPGFRDRPAGTRHPTATDYSNPDDFVADCDRLRCQAAIVASPPSTHEPLVRQLLDLGCAVLCEKPLSTDLASARRMLDAARNTGRPLVLASKFRFTAPVQAAQTWIEEGRLGEPLAYENVFSAPVSMADRWNADPSVSGGGVLQDNGPHAADLARALCGPIESVAAASPRRAQALQVEDGVRLLFRFESGAVGTSDLSWSLPAARRELAVVRGERGTIFVRWDGAELVPADGSAPQHRAEGYDKRIAFAAQLDEFLALVRGRGHSTVTDDDALSAVAFVEAAYRALESGSFTPLEHSAEGRAGSSAG